MKKESTLTIKQRKWIKEYIETGNATEAAMRVYDCKDRDSARALGSENVAKLSIPDLMEEMGLSDVALMNIGVEGMQANKQISGIIIGDSKDANSKTSSFVEVPDYPTRHKYWETMLKLKKRLGPDNQILQQFNSEELKIEFI